jgi:hypothetical protein
MHSRMNVIRFSRIVIMIKKKTEKKGKWKENNEIGNSNLVGTIINIHMLEYCRIEKLKDTYS